MFAHEWGYNSLQCLIFIFLKQTLALGGILQEIENGNNVSHASKCSWDILNQIFSHLTKTFTFHHQAILTIWIVYILHCATCINFILRIINGEYTQEYFGKSYFGGLFWTKKKIIKNYNFYFPFLGCCLQSLAGHTPGIRHVRPHWAYLKEELWASWN